MAATLETTGLATAVIDALGSQICVIDKTGVIIAVNRAWRKFSADNGGDISRSDIGTHYLRTCRNSSGPGAEEACDFERGVRAVLEGNSEVFELEYPCHSPSELRWFLGRATPLRIEAGGAVISHSNITDRKLAELELAKLAATDPLTGIPNRRYFLDAAAREVDRVHRFGKWASVVMIDLDHFKAVNDTKGHAVGDKALSIAARACQENLREIDILARMGGEEFVAILPETNMEGASKAAEKLRSVVSQAEIDVGGDVMHVTASFGVSEVWPSDASIHDSLGRADKALYEAKAAGRNCVRCSVATQSPLRRAS